MSSSQSHPTLTKFDDHITPRGVILATGDDTVKAIRIMRRRY